LNVDIPSGDGGIRALWSSFDGVQHLLLVYGSADDARAIEPIVAGHQDTLRLVRFDGHSIEHQAASVRYRMPEPGWVLIRPDMVIAARGVMGDVSRLRDYLDSVMPGKVSA